MPAKLPLTVAAVRIATSSTQAIVSLSFARTSTVPASMAGLPGISVPAGLSDEGLPLGLQLLGQPFDEARMLNAAHFLESAAEFTAKPAWLMEGAA